MYINHEVENWSSTIGSTSVDPTVGTRYSHRNISL